MDPDVGVVDLVTVEVEGALVIEEMGVVALVIAAEVGLEIGAGDPIKKNGIDVVVTISIVHRPDCMYMYNFKHKKITLNVWNRNLYSGTVCTPPRSARIAGPKS